MVESFEVRRDQYEIPEKTEVDIHDQDMLDLHWNSVQKQSNSFEDLRHKLCLINCENSQFSLKILNSTIPKSSEMVESFEVRRDQYEIPEKTEVDIHDQDMLDWHWNSKRSNQIHWRPLS